MFETIEFIRVFSIRKVISYHWLYKKNRHNVVYNGLGINRMVNDELINSKSRYKKEQLILQKTAFHDTNSSLLHCKRIYNDNEKHINCLILMFK